LAAQLAESDFEQDIREVLRTLEGAGTAAERAPRTILSDSHLALPARLITPIEGVVITFLDVTKIREAERRALAAQDYAESIVETVREPLLVLDAGLRIKSATKAFYETFQVFEDATVDIFFMSSATGNGIFRSCAGC